jgi:hypothetical protein
MMESENDQNVVPFEMKHLHHYSQPDIQTNVDTSDPAAYAMSTI